jgi:hypothetical protein
LRHDRKSWVTSSRSFSVKPSRCSSASISPRRHGRRRLDVAWVRLTEHHRESPSPRISCISGLRS